MAKIWDVAGNEAAELLSEIQTRNRLDGVVDEQEAALECRAELVYCLVEEIGLRRRIADRIGGGGKFPLHRELTGQVRDLAQLREMAEIGKARTGGEPARAVVRSEERAA